MSDWLKTLKQLTSKGGIEGYFAIKYDQFAQKNMMEEYRRLAAKVVSIAREGKVLEVGAGPGYISIEIAKLAPGLEIVGLDISETMVEIATEHADKEGVSRQLSFQKGDASRMPFENFQFDFVISSGSLHHWKEPTKIFDEIYRVLKPGKTDLRRDASKEKLDEIVRGIDSRFMRWGAKHSVKESYTLPEVEDLLKKTQFGNFKVNAGEVNIEIWLKKQSSH